MRDRVILVGLDFGTTTSCAAIASAELACNSCTGRMELSRVEPVSQPTTVFTPFAGHMLDEERLSEYLAAWLADVDRDQVFGGGALVTGLAAQQSNAKLVARQTRRFLREAVIATANDPCLESWLAFMGNCVELSRAHPDRPIINLDIGGGTTNIALGRAGEVSRTGSYFVGARHIMVEPGGYRITGLSHGARQLLRHLQVRKEVGDELAAHEVLAIVDWYLNLLRAVISGAVVDPGDPIVHHVQQVPFELPADAVSAAVTLSGGVGQLVYQYLQALQWPSTTVYGDLGVDLAKRIVESPFWQERLGELRPLALGRATVYGLLRYSTQASGATLYLPDATVLPLGDLLIVGALRPESPDEEIEHLLTLAGRSTAGACLRIEWPQQSPPVQAFAARLGKALDKHPRFRTIPLVILMQQNLGRVFGEYLTRWGTAAFKVIVIDEVEHQNVQLAQIGRPQHGVVPVSLYGMNLTGECHG